MEVEIGLHYHLLSIAVEVEAQGFGDALHGVVVEEDLRGDAFEALGAAYLEEPVKEHSTDAPALEAVADQDRELGFIGDGAVAAEAGDAQDLTLSRLPGRMFGDQRHLAVV